MFNIDIINIQDYTREQIFEGIVTNDGVISITINYNVIGSTLYSHEVAMEHLSVAFLLNRISEYCSINNVEQEINSFPHNTRYILEINKEKHDFIDRLVRYGTWFTDCELLQDVNDEFFEFRNNIDNYYTEFSDPVEKAYANFVTRGIYELAAEADENDDVFLEQYFFKQHPEWKFGYWKHHKKGIPTNSLYYSHQNWVIKTIDRDAIFMALYGKITVFEECWIRGEIAYCKYGAVTTHIPNETQAVLFLSSILTDLSTSTSRYFLSENDDILIIDKGVYSIVVFDFVPAKEQQILKCYSELSEQSHYLSRLLGINDETNIDWSKWSPELFEDLCYDIIRVRFAHKDVHIERMGNTRSRDGGRDIMIIERMPFNPKETKYIVQCKLRTDGKSLSANRITNVTDVVMKFNADAYIIMTNELIDSTLHDLLDGLSESKLQVDTSIRYDGKKISHFLSLHRNIRDKYIPTMQQIG